MMKSDYFSFCILLCAWDQPLPMLTVTILPRINLDIILSLWKITIKCIWEKLVTQKLLLLARLLIYNQKLKSIILCFEERNISRPLERGGMGMAKKPFNIVFRMLNDVAVLSTTDLAYIKITFLVLFLNYHYWNLGLHRR